MHCTVIQSAQMLHTRAELCAHWSEYNIFTDFSERSNFMLVFVYLLISQ